MTPILNAVTVIESPYGSNPDGSRADDATIAVNVAYMRAAIVDCLRRGEAPFASHGLYPGALRDSHPFERALGIEAGLVIGRILAAAGAVRACYVDRGWTEGMRQGEQDAGRIGQAVQYRGVRGWP